MRGAPAGALAALAWRACDPLLKRAAGAFLGAAVRRR